MVFVTVGTHEQQFNRLVECVDKLKEKGIIKEEVVIQTGYSDYVPKNCVYSNFLSYQDMKKYESEARIIITHGGPSSFISALQIGKTPIVVPRRYEFGEHINDHQFDFCKMVKERQNNILLIENIVDLEYSITNYDVLVKELNNNLESNTDKFCNELDKIVTELIK